MLLVFPFKAFSFLLYIYIYIYIYTLAILPFSYTLSIFKIINHISDILFFKLIFKIEIYKNKHNIIIKIK